MVPLSNANAKKLPCHEGYVSSWNTRFLSKATKFEIIAFQWIRHKGAIFKQAIHSIYFAQNVNCKFSNTVSLPLWPRFWIIWEMSEFQILYKVIPCNSRNHLDNRQEQTLDQLRYPPCILFVTNVGLIGQVAAGCHVFIYRLLPIE